MTQNNPTFNPQQFELRNYTNPYLTPQQSEDVTSVEGRVSGELDFVAQMLGWSGPNYWSSLYSSVNQQRQLLTGSYGVYNSFVIPRIYEIRNWDNTIVIDRLQFVEPNRQTYVERIILGEDTYTLQSVSVEGDKYVISVGELPQSFYDQIAANTQLKVDIPTYRPAPFRRSQVGASGDGSFICAASGSDLKLYPAWDNDRKFAYLFPIIFAGSVYYFDQPVYLTLPTVGASDVLPNYDEDLGLWYLSIPADLTDDQAGVEGTLIWSYSDSSVLTNVTTQVNIVPWVDPSDWNSLNVLENYRGVWNNKGGALPFNFAFDALSIHGFNEQRSLYLGSVSKTLPFNNLVTQVYSQLTPFTEIPPGVPNAGDLWWNPTTGALSAWFPNDSNCGYWVEIDYRDEPTLASSAYIFTDVPSFIVGQGALPTGTVVTILDITGLSIAENVIGVKGTLSSPGSATIYKADSSIYWTPLSFTYNTVSDFNADAPLLPYKIPVTLFDATGLSPNNGVYKVQNLDVTVAGDYELVLTKLYTNSTWELTPESVLRYIANSSLYSAGGNIEGEMWWDFANTDPNVRSAAIYYGSAWVAVNSHPQSGPPAPVLDMSTVLFYSDDNLLTDGVTYATDSYSITYTSNPLTGEYTIDYTPRTYLGKVQPPKITISDSLTTAYTADISEFVFGDINYVMSPNVYDAETPLRLWKGQDLQVAETLAHLAENNYVNPLLADLNNGPGPENWERYFVRLPLDYGRNETRWQKTTLICQDFGYWGSTVNPEKMLCPPEDDLPAIYEELFLYDEPVPDYTYVYCEPYLYSNLAYIDTGEVGNYRNAGVFPASDVQFDEFNEAELITYEPLHNRLADVTSPVNAGYGNWVGEYVNINPCVGLTGFLTTDLLNGGVAPVEAPVWDASIYKFPPTCESSPESFTVDANHYKIGYCYFVADASAAEDGFFDPQQEISWRYPVTQPRTGYLTPR